MDCDRNDLLIGLLEDALDPGERTAVEAHLEGCEACREVVEAYRGAAGALAGLDLPEPSEEATSRAYAAVLGAMEQDADAADRGAGGAGEGPSAGGRILRWGPLLAAAACLLVGVSLIVAPLAGRSQVAEAPAAEAADEAAAEPARSEAAFKHQRTPATDGLTPAADAPAAPREPDGTVEATTALDAAREKLRTAARANAEAEAQALAKGSAEERRAEAREAERRAGLEGALSEEMKAELDDAATSLAQAEELLPVGDVGPAGGAEPAQPPAAAPEPARQGAPADAATADFGDEGLADLEQLELAEAEADEAGAEPPEEEVFARTLGGETPAADAADEATGRLRPAGAAPQPPELPGAAPAGEPGLAGRTEAARPAAVREAWRVESPDGVRVYALRTDGKLTYADQPTPRRVRTQGAASTRARAVDAQADAARRARTPAQARDLRVAEELLAILRLELTPPPSRAQLKRGTSESGGEADADGAPEAAASKAREAASPSTLRQVFAALGERVTGAEPAADLRSRLARLTEIHRTAKLRLRARRAAGPDLEEAPPAAESR